MVALIVLTSLALQSDVDRWVKELSAEKIDDRTRASARLETLGREFEDAAGLWRAARDLADPAAAARLGRIRQAWRIALRDFVPAEPVVSAASALLPEEDREVLAALRRIRVGLDMTRAPLTEIVDHLRELSGINIHITGIDNPDQLLLSFQSAEQPLESLLKQLLRPHELAYSVRDGILLVTTVGNLRKNLKLELYDVQDLVVGTLPSVLIDRIVRRTPPHAWKEDRGASIQHQNGILIVRTGPDIHRTILKYLQQLRTGEPEEVLREPDAAVIFRFAALVGSGADGAELRLSRMAGLLAEALRALDVARRGPDLERSLRSADLLRSLHQVLSSERVRRLLETDELRGAVREFRSAWLRDGFIEDFDDLARDAFGARSTSTRLVLKAVVDGSLITPEVGLILWKGDAVVFVKDGKPYPATMERWLDPDGGTLIFTLPQELGDRLAGEGPACVVVERSR